MNSNRDRQTSYAIMALKENAAKYSVAYTFSPRESSVVKPLENCTEEMKEVNDSRCFKVNITIIAITITITRCFSKEYLNDTLDLVPGAEIVWPGSCDNEVYRALQFKFHPGN